jgi:hypothetical protein|tara:strand:- start:2598 stop:2828 length:231 start_codon:yes stop_codon:yes gene_type:complete
MKQHIGPLTNSEQYQYSIDVTKPCGDIDTILAWAKEQLVGQWRWQLVQVSSTAQPGRYIFYFDSEADYLAFVMKFL